MVRAKEIGLARYQRIVDFDWSPGLDFGKIHRNSGRWLEKRGIERLQLPTD